MKHRPPTSIKSAASILAAALMLVSMVLIGVSPGQSLGRDQAYLDAISAAAKSLPYRIGPWIGADIEPQQPAVELLKPNALMQRRYVRSDGSASFTLLFVHCGDARDMQGHYPPVCYPAHGWVITGSVPSSFILGRVEAPARIYRMSALRGGNEQRMTIMNFFAVPSESQPLAPDMNAVNRAAGGTARAALGAAQTQLIVGADVSDEHMAALMSEIAPALEPIVSQVIHASANARQ